MTFDEKLGIPFAIVVLAAVVFMMFWPSSRYLDVQKLDVLDAIHGDPVLIDYRREIHRPFYGSWAVTIYRNGEAYCEASSPGVRQYRPEAMLPNPVTLAWLTYTNPKCHVNLPCGAYDIYADWTLNPNSKIFRRKVPRYDRFLVICD